MQAPPAAAPPEYSSPLPGYTFPYEPSRPPPLALDAHTHSGFFLRMTVGTGYMGDSTSLSGEGYAGEVTAKGPAATFEIDVGGSLVPGFSLSGSFLMHSIANSTLTDDSRTFTAPGTASPSSSRLSQNPQLSVLGMMADLYPDPRKGLHAGAILGFASMQARPSGDDNGSSSGFSFAPHVGYEWWVGSYWGLGVLGRLLYARTRGPYATGSQLDRVLTATVSFSATYN
jgi:hypothetical protein